VLFVDMSICDSLSVPGEPERRNRSWDGCLLFWHFYWINQWMRCISVKQWHRFSMN